MLVDLNLLNGAGHKDSQCDCQVVTLFDFD